MRAPQPRANNLPTPTPPVVGAQSAHGPPQSLRGFARTNPHKRIVQNITKRIAADDHHPVEPPVEKSSPVATPPALPPQAQCAPSAPPAPPQSAHAAARSADPPTASSAYDA